MKTVITSISALRLLCSTAHTAEIKIKSPDGNAVIVVTDAGGLNYSVVFNGREVVNKSRFGIVADGVDLGAEGNIQHRINAERSSTQTDGVTRPGRKAQFDTGFYCECTR